MKRPMTLTGFILSTVMQAVYTVIELLGFALIIEMLTSLDATAEFSIIAVIMILTLALSIVSLVFNAIAISAWNKSPEVYRKKRGIVVTAIVFNFILVLFLIIGMASESVAVLDVLLLLACVATNVLAIIDLAREKKKVEILEAEEAVATEVAEQPKTDVETKIEKLNEMKAQGMINEEEYAELKKKYISESIK